MTVTAAARPIALGAVTVAAAAVLRARQRRWGATNDEVNRTLPGDDLISHADLTATRAITIHATAAQVWPWSRERSEIRQSVEREIYFAGRTAKLVALDVFDEIFRQMFTTNHLHERQARVNAR